MGSSMRVACVLKKRSRSYPMRQVFTCEARPMRCSLESINSAGSLRHEITLEQHGGHKKNANA
eukprot:4850630-Pleurochrysis_carterae.AAC.1